MLLCTPSEMDNPQLHIGCMCHRPGIRAMTHRLDKAASQLGFSFAAAVAPDSIQQAAASSAAQPILFSNVRIFDGRSPTLREGVQVLIEGNRIAELDESRAEPPDGTERIDCGGRVLMPGLIDAHVHLVFENITLAEGFNADIGYVFAAAVRGAERQLLRGFTSVRDVGGPSFGLKRAIDSGLVPGPRIYPSGGAISQTGGHGDFGGLNEVPRQPGAPLSYPERHGMSYIADGVDAVLVRARENLRQGATQLKLMAGGGVASNYDPLDVTEYTEAELRAGVEAARNWGTYVTVHAYTPRAIQQSVAAGVRCIEHGHLADEETARIMADKGIWWCLQPFLDDEDAVPFAPGSPNRIKQLAMIEGTDVAYGLAKAHGIRTAFGTDTLFSSQLATRQGAQLAKLARWYSPVDVLRMATSGNAELLALSGPRNPYEAPLGVIEEGALADLLLVNGNPLEAISLIEDPERNFKIIMKDGKIHKNTLQLLH